MPHAIHNFGHEEHSVHVKNNGFRGGLGTGTALGSRAKKKPQNFAQIRAFKSDACINHRANSLTHVGGPR
jgi:hypothetical protein